MPGRVDAIPERVGPRRPFGPATGLVLMSRGRSIRISGRRPPAKGGSRPRIPPGRSG